MRKVPTSWDGGIWDIGSKEYMGRDGIPTLYDANISGFLPNEYAAGIGRAQDLYVSDIIPYSKVEPYPSAHPSGNVWRPRIRSGYFYIGRDEYYCYAKKNSKSGTPTTGYLHLGTFNHQFPTMGAPIVVTDNASEFEPWEPFAKTWEPTPSGSVIRTANKYRKRTDLTGRKEYVVDVSGYLQNYVFTLDDHEFMLVSSGVTSTNPKSWDWWVRCNPSGSQIEVEYEVGTSGYFDVDYVDMNESNSYEVGNTFIALSYNSDLLPADIDLTYVNRYAPIAGQTVRFIAAVKDSNGTPVSGVTVTFASDGGGTFTPTAGATIWDGTILSTWVVPNVSYGVKVTATCGGV